MITKFYYTLKFGTQLVRFAKSLYTGDGIKTNETSRQIYEHYDNREQVDYDRESRVCLYKGKLEKLSLKEIRERYLEYLFEEIPQSTSSILEVGCGNCINLYNLKGEYPVKLTGIDIASNRIKIASEYFGDSIAGIDLIAPLSITEETPFPENHFDVVFSMHCLEQIAYDSRAAIAEMYRIAKKKVVLIEPVYEHGNAAQRLYLTAQDHNRVLLRSIQELGLEVDRCEPLNIQSNPLNQSSIITIAK